MLELTGERLLPDRQAGELVHAEHLARYRLAAQLAARRRVLDAASGEGYGTALLAAAGAASVVGIDLDPAAVEHARARYGVRFERADIVALPFEDASFDLVACFETIEHVREPEAVVRELRRVLAADGVLVISTPNPRRYLDPNPFHLSELPPEQLVAVLRRYFEPVHLMYQDDVLTSLVLDAAQLSADDHPLDLALTKLVGLEPGHELYTVAVCGPGPRPRPLGVASAVYEAHAMAEELRAWPERAAEAERLVGEWHARATEAERQVEEWRARYAEIAGSTSWRLTRPLREARRRLRRGP